MPNVSVLHSFISSADVSVVESISPIVFLYRETKKTLPQRRLEILNKSNDGFYIAGEDLKLRGPGDLFGIRQSGVMEFRIGDIYNDSSILKSASEAASEILSLDPDLTLPQNQLLKEQLQIVTNRSILVP